MLELNPIRRSPERLKSLCNILRCPQTFEPLILTEEQKLKSALSERPWPIEEGVPNFLPQPALVQSDDHTSNVIATGAQKLIDETSGLTLNVSAGGTENPPANVVEVEYAAFRNTDMTADVHNLPFRDNVFDTVICLNAFEHYHSPLQASAELFRVLKKGGQLFVHTAFLQPVHEAPHHYFNCTEYGLRQWFSQFELVELSVSANFNPLYALSWFAAQLIAVLDTPAQKDLIASTTISDLATFWQRQDNSQLLSAFAEIPEHQQRLIAAGFQYVGRK